MVSDLLHLIFRQQLSPGATVTGLRARLALLPVLLQQFLRFLARLRSTLLTSLRHIRRRRRGTVARTRGGFLLQHPQPLLQTQLPIHPPHPELNARLPTRIIDRLSLRPLHTDKVRRPPERTLLWKARRTERLRYRSHALAGAAAFLVFAAGAAAPALLARLDARALSGVGIAMLPAGLALVSAATWLASLPALLAGGVLCGAGAGVIFKGGINTVLDLAPPEARAEALATFFLASYLGLAGPILGLGIATQYLSARRSLLGFAGVLIVALGALAPVLLRGGSQRGPGRGRGRGRGRRAAEITYQGAGS